MDHHPYMHQCIKASSVHFKMHLATKWSVPSVKLDNEAAALVVCRTRVLSAGQAARSPSIQTEEKKYSSAGCGHLSYFLDWWETLRGLTTGTRWTQYTHASVCVVCECCKILQPTHNVPTGHSKVIVNPQQSQQLALKLPKKNCKCCSWVASDKTEVSIILQMLPIK